MYVNILIKSSDLQNISLQNSELQISNLNLAVSYRTVVLYLPKQHDKAVQPLELFDTLTSY